VQLIGSIPAADEESVTNAIYIAQRLMARGGCRDEVTRQLAADRAAVAAVVRATKCKDCSTRRLIGDVFVALAQGMVGLNARF
jgi:hypothetical protein